MFFFWYLTNDCLIWQAGNRLLIFANDRLRFLLANYENYSCRE